MRVNRHRDTLCGSCNAANSQEELVSAFALALRARGQYGELTVENFENGGSLGRFWEHVNHGRPQCYQRLTIHRVSKRTEIAHELAHFLFV
jgi:hypothetical protein